MEPLKEHLTCELVEELKSREGVEVRIIAPYERHEVSVEGPVVILTVID